MSRLSLLSGLAVAALGCCLLAAPARADVFVTNDGHEIDGQVMREDGGFVWVRLALGKVVKLSLGEVKDRRPGESPWEKAKALEKQIKTTPKDAELHWALYQIVAPYAEEPADRKTVAKLLEKVLELAPDHEAARKVHGDVQFEGMWVPEHDLERVKAEFEHNKKLNEWRDQIGIKEIELYETAHYTLIDATGEKDLIGRAEQLELAYDALKALLAVEPWPGRCAVITVKYRDDYLRIVDKYQAEQWHMADWWIKIAHHESCTGVWRHRPAPVMCRWVGKSSDMMWSAIINSTGHLVCWQHWRNKVPAWMEEGLAAWVELEVTDEHVISSVGASSKKKGKTTDRRKRKKGTGSDRAQGHSEWRDTFVEAMGTGEFPPLRKFLGMELGEFGLEEEGGCEALVIWLASLGPEKFAKLFQSLRGVSRPDPVWEDCYEFALIEDMEKAFKIWVLSEW